MGFSITGQAAALNDDPFFWVRLDRSSLDDLAGKLRECSQREREWFTLAATYENPARLRLLKQATPNFEADASPFYLRGEILRVSGTEHRSCNITFSNLGARQLLDRIQSAAKRMRRFMELRIVSRRHGLIEFVPDVDARRTADPDDALAKGLESAQASALPPDDFSDWEP